MAPRWIETWALAGVALAGAACGTDAVGVQACRQVQEAQCQAAPACGVSLEPPYHTNGTAVDECIRFYDDACLHGLASGTDPGATAVNACVAAIRSAAAAAACSVVVTPSTSPACAWMAVSSSASDASSSSVEAATDDGGDAE